MRVSNLNGYGFQIEGQVQKALNRSTDVQYFLGLKASASLSHVQFDGASGFTSGPVGT